VHGEIYIARKYLRPLEENQYFKSDLLGLEVQDTNGTRLGKVAEIIDTQAASLLQLEGGKVLIPLVPRIVLEINLEEELIIIDPPEGLLELNED
jgi:16S rRNA processing protein RimM